MFGVAYPGELLAIMGSSGAGKTTLLNTLTFRSGSSVSVTGRRCVNGVRVGRNALAALSAYVQQDDLFIGTLTVREHLVFQALVRMDRHIPYSRRMRRVDEVISEVGDLQQGYISMIRPCEKGRISCILSHGGCAFLTGPYRPFCLLSPAGAVQVREHHHRRPWPRQGHLRG